MSKVMLSCECGAVKGVANHVSAETGNHVICLCDDCQAYIKYLKKEDEILDSNGGTRIFQLTPSQVEILTGREHVKCLNLREKGLMRWYASCCDTPIANTLRSHKVPFVGMPTVFFDFATSQVSEKETLGPIIESVQGRFARGEMPEGAHRRISAKTMLRTAKLLLKAWVGRKHLPSPFFDGITGKPLANPQVLTKEERKPLY